MWQGTFQSPSFLLFLVCLTLTATLVLDAMNNQCYGLSCSMWHTTMGPDVAPPFHNPGRPPGNEPAAQPDGFNLLFSSSRSLYLDPPELPTLHAWSVAGDS